MLLLALAACVALGAVLVAQAGAYTRNVTHFGQTGSGPSDMRLPGGVAVSPDGESVYVVDTGNDRIDEFNADGSEFIRSWGYGVIDGKAKLETCTAKCHAGQFGPGAGELNEPSAIAVAPDGTVYVVNHSEFDGRVQAFNVSGPNVTYAGALPAGYGHTGANEVDFNSLPFSNNVAVGSDGRVYVLDNLEGSSRIYVFDRKTNTHEELPTGSIEKPYTFGIVHGGRIVVTGRYGETALLKPDGEQIREFYAGGGLSAIAVVSGSKENFLGESSSLSNGGVTLKEFTETGKTLREIPLSPVTQGIEEPGAYGLALNPAFRYSNKYDPAEYRQGVIYLADRFGNTVIVGAEQKPGKPMIETVPAQEVTATGASLAGRVVPTGLDTHAYFEYGTTDTYGSAVPVPPGIDLGSSFLQEQIAVHLPGLQPDTTYHFALVATNAAGTVVGEDSTFTTFPLGGGPVSLPDGRAYELATPDAGTADLSGIFAARDGNGVAFTSPSILPGSSTGGLGAGYVGLRGTDGWRREAASIPTNFSLSTNTILMAPDLTQTVGTTTSELTPGAPVGTKLYLRDNATGAYTLMTPRIFKPFTDYEGYGASADFRHIVFRANGSLTPDTAEESSSGLFEFSGGTLKNIGILPGATEPTGTIVRPGLRPTHPVSEDGSRVFFGAEPGEGAAVQAYASIDGSRTVQLSASQRTKAPDKEAAQQPANIVGAAADGSAVFFTSSARLTDDAATGTEEGKAKDRSPNLYRYDTTTGRLTDLTVATAATDKELGAAVTGGVLVAANGKSAYFVANGALAAGGTSGLQNLYRWTFGTGITYVANLNEGDILTGVREYDEAATSVARVTADGSVLAFTSRTPLDPAFPKVETEEIYRYSAADGSIACVSCARAGTGQVATKIYPPNPISAGYGGNVLSGDGSKVFFTTSAAIVPADTNAKNDVYEWENGSAKLISSGAGTTGSALVDASASGEDVFFATGDQLVPSDRLDYTDVYDAKVGGGLPEPATAAPPCEAENCLPKTEAAPPAATLGSKSFNGPQNRKAKHHRKKKHKRKKHRKHAKQRRQTRSHGHPAVGKHG